MFGIPGEVFWPTAAFATIIALIFGGIALLRLVPASRSGSQEPGERETLEELRLRLGQLDQLQQRVNELEERVDFTERVLSQPNDPERLAPPRDAAAG
jgi:hypothetical protein